MRLALLMSLLCLIPEISLARSITTVETWTGDVHLSEAVRIETGGTLIVAPGSRIVAEAGIEVAGTLKADGAEFTGSGWPGIVLTRVSEDTRVENCLISGAQTGVTVLGGNPLLQKNIIEKNRVGLEFRQKSAAQVMGNRFRDNGRVGLFLKDEARVSVVDNRFEGQGKYGAYIYRSQPKVFRDNTFIGNPVGLMISHFGSDPRIEHNQFRGNHIGIKVDRAAKPTLRLNRLDKNETAIDLSRRSDPVIEQNRFSENHHAIEIRFSSYPKIRLNDFIQNEKALFLEYQSSLWEESKGTAARNQQISAKGAFAGKRQSQVTEEQRRARGLDGTVSARDNWWGTEETQILDRDYRDRKDVNLDWIVDGFDHESFEEGGRTYPLDRVRWQPYSRQSHTQELMK